jgi:hypothetical protein
VPKFWQRAGRGKLPSATTEPTDIECKELLLTGLWNGGCVCISRVLGG